MIKGSTATCSNPRMKRHFTGSVSSMPLICKCYAVSVGIWGGGGGNDEEEDEEEKGKQQRQEQQ